VLAIELHNTIRKGPVDTLSADLRGWLETVADRLPVDPGAVDVARLDDFLALRAAVRAALHAPDAIPAAAVAELNQRSGANPRSLELPGRERHHGATATDVVLGVIAADAIALVSGDAELRVCGAPGRVLMFVKDHPRREWCSNACGNRARQARHYARVQAARSGPSSPRGR
jgi:predicted RNA-binding Zn ribbon-like protein